MALDVIKPINAFDNEIDDDILSLYILGEIFMKKYYTIYNRGNDKIGIALGKKPVKLNELIKQKLVLRK